MNLARTIRRARGDETLRGTARKIGIHPSYLARIENGTEVPSDRVLRLIASTLDLDTNKLISAAGRKKKPKSEYEGVRRYINNLVMRYLIRKDRLAVYNCVGDTQRLAEFEATPEGERQAIEWMRSNRTFTLQK